LKMKAIIVLLAVVALANSREYHLNLRKLVFSKDLNEFYLQRVLPWLVVTVPMRLANPSTQTTNATF
jgi:hypothetical protein